MLTKDICQRTGLKGTSRVALLLCVSQLQQLVNDILFVHQYWNHACAQCNLYEACCTRNIPLEQPLKINKTMHRAFICSHTKGNKLTVHCKMQPEVCRRTPKKNILTGKTCSCKCFNLCSHAAKVAGKFTKNCWLCITGLHPLKDNITIYAQPLTKDRWFRDTISRKKIV